GTGRSAGWPAAAPRPCLASRFISCAGGRTFQVPPSVTFLYIAARGPDINALRPRGQRVSRGGDGQAPPLAAALPRRPAPPPPPPVRRRPARRARPVGARPVGGGARPSVRAGRRPRSGAGTAGCARPWGW